MGSWGISGFIELGSTKGKWQMEFNVSETVDKEKNNTYPDSF